MLAILVGVVAGPFLLLLLWRQWHGRLHQTYSGFGPSPSAPQPPPTIPGLPLLGNAVAVGRGGAAFVQECHNKYGDAFTLCLLGQRMTFLFAAPSIEHYFTAPDSEITFGPAVQQFTHRIFGLPPKHFFGKHYIMLSALREELAPAGLARYGEALLALGEQELSTWPEKGEVELYSAMQALVFNASVSTLFGPAFLQAHSAPALQQAFFDLESRFELAASPLPHLLQPTFCRARAKLLAALRSSLLAGHFKGTVAAALIEACGLPQQYIPNMLLALLWASQANSVPATFWSLAFLLLPENQGFKRTLLEQLASPVTANGLARGGNKGSSLGKNESSLHGGCSNGKAAHAAHGSPLLREALDRQSLLVRCVVETLRLRAMSIDVRIAAADVAVPVGEEGRHVLINKGSVVALSPYASHQDQRLYGPSCSEFDPDREGMLFGGSTKPHAAVVGVGGLAGLSFGGGKYRCPGRYFAELEVGLLLGLLLTKFDFQLLRGSPTEQQAQQAQQVSTQQQQEVHMAQQVQHAQQAQQQQAHMAQHAQQLQQAKQGVPNAGQRGLPNRGSQGGGGAGGALSPGDPGGLLPPLQLQKLVGLKVPAGPCWVRFARR